jgi:hypothetical protein
MRFPMPKYPCEFEIPDEWWAEAGMVGFTPSGRRGYRSTAAAMLMPLLAIEPPTQYPETPKDWRGFDRTRLVYVLNGIATGAEIEPVRLVQLPAGDFFVPAQYQYWACDGFHRFYATIAAGFPCLPAAIAVAGRARP